MTSEEEFTDKNYPVQRIRRNRYVVNNQMFSLENFSGVFLRNQGLSSEVVIYKHMKINCTDRCVICLQ